MAYTYRPSSGATTYDAQGPHANKPPNLEIPPKAEIQAIASHALSLSPPRDAWAMVQSWMYAKLAGVRLQDFLSQMGNSIMETYIPKEGEKGTWKMASKPNGPPAPLLPHEMNKSDGLGGLLMQSRFDGDRLVAAYHQPKPGLTVGMSHGFMNAANRFDGGPGEAIQMAVDSLWAASPGEPVTLTSVGGLVGGKQGGFAVAIVHDRQGFPVLCHAAEV